MQLAPIDQESLSRLSDEQLRDLVEAHEALFRGRCRDDIVFCAQNTELPSAPAALTDIERKLLAERKTRLQLHVVDDRENISFGVDEQFYARKLDVADHQAMILEAIQGTIENRPINGPLANGMDGTVPDGVMIFCPPGAAKSSYASVFAPSYLLGKYKNFDVISVSYASELAVRFGRRVRSICRSQAFIDKFDTTLVEDNQAVHQWTLKNGSSYRAVGIMGGVTGSRADFIAIDDPVAGREEADSEIIREKTWQAYKDDILTRLKPGGKLALIMTRWHEDDLAGRILGPKWEGKSGLWREHTADGSVGRVWLVLCMPMVSEHVDDPLGRAKGDVLWAAKPDGSGWFTERHVSLAKSSGERTWSALYQQRPSAMGGNIIRRDLWKCWPHGRPEPTAEQKENPHDTKPPEEITGIFLTYDTAFEDGEDNDDSAMTAWGFFERTVTLPHRKGDQVKHQHIILLGAWKDKVDAIKLYEVVESHVKHFKPDYIVIEKRASGIQLIQELRRRRPRHSHGPVIVEAWLPQGPPGTKGKRPRAFAAALTMAEGCVWYMPGPKTEEVRKQCASFRTGDDGTPDDWTDCVTSAISRSRSGFALDTPKDELDDKEQFEVEADEVERQRRPRGSYGHSQIGEKTPMSQSSDGDMKRRLYGRMT